MHRGILQNAVKEAEILNNYKKNNFTTNIKRIKKSFSYAQRPGFKNR
jgi:hypothetical protein